MEAGRCGIPAPFSLQSLLDQGAKSIWGKAMDRVTYLGWNGQPGLINNTNIAYSIAPNGASGFPQWTKKTTTEILNDFNTVLLATQSGSGYDTAGLADTVLVDFTHWNISESAHDDRCLQQLARIHPGEQHGAAPGHRA